MKVSMMDMILLGGLVGLMFTVYTHTSEIGKLEKRVTQVVKATEKPKQDIHQQAVDVILWAESRNGTAPNLDVPGPDGELGPWQVTPIWIADIKRLTGETVDPMDTDATRKQVLYWLKHYGPKVGAETVGDFWQLYRRGPTGYRRWKGE